MKVSNIQVFLTFVGVGIMFSCKQKTPDSKENFSPKVADTASHVTSPHSVNKKTSKALKVNPVEFNTRYPSYEAGDEAMIQFIKKQIRYPQQAKEKKIEGTVYIKFFVDTLGKVSKASVIKGIGCGCDEEAVRVVSLLGRFRPARRDGKLVGDFLSCPVHFKLKD